MLARAILVAIRCRHYSGLARKSIQAASIVLAYCWLTETSLVLYISSRYPGREIGSHWLQ